MSTPSLDPSAIHVHTTPEQTMMKILRSDPALYEKSVNDRWTEAKQHYDTIGRGTFLLTYESLENAHNFKPTIAMQYMAINDELIKQLYGKSMRLMEDYPPERAYHVLIHLTSADGKVSKTRELTFSLPPAEQ